VNPESGNVGQTSRWRTPEGERLALEVFGKLLAGKPLDDLRLPHHQGRVDLRGIVAPPADRLRTLDHKGWAVQELGGLLEFRRAQLTNLDMSSGQLNSLRFFHTTITNCRFDGAKCQDWRMWAIDVADTTFVKADLRNAVLGAWHEGRGDVFTKVDFSAANLRSIVCPAATFTDCDFNNAHLAKVDFQSSSFIRCRFAGLMREVMFYDHGFKTGKPDPNPMEDVDFSEAELRMVEFRRLDLDRVKFPTSSDHLVVRHYRCVLECALRELQGNSKWTGLRAIFEHQLKWAGPHQERGVFNRRDYVEMFGEEEAEFAIELLQRLEAECSSR
jgi:uncharacterized protein YjbI with pentapeptide repeats